MSRRGRREILWGRKHNSTYGSCAEEGGKHNSEPTSLALFFVLRGKGGDLGGTSQSTVKRFLNSIAVLLGAFTSSEECSFYYDFPR